MSDAALTATERFADVAILRPVSCFQSGAHLQVDQLLLSHGEPVTVLPHSTDALAVGTTVWSLGFPQIGGSSATSASFTNGGTHLDDHGQWIKSANGGMMPGHSGGPVVDLQGRAVGWNVRDKIHGPDKICHFRCIRDGQACIQKALDVLAL